MTALSKRELQRGGALARVKAGGIRLTDGAVLMRVSHRQAKRLWKRYQAGGVAGLQNANAGRTSNRARPAKQRRKILRKVEEKYSGFGPTLAAEHLGMEDQLPVHPDRDVAAADALRGTVEEGAAAQTASQKARGAGALRGVAADGRQFP